MVREFSVQEQKYQAVLAVLAEGVSVREVAQPRVPRAERGGRLER